MIHITLKYGPVKHQVEVSPDYQLGDLMAEAQRLTGVPVAGQKLIFNGKTLLPDPDYSNKTLKEYNIKNDAKIMVLGKKFDPESDRMFSTVTNVELKCMEIKKSANEAEREISDIEKGFLDKSYQESALKNLTKKCRNCSENFMRLLEELDGLRFEDHQSVAKSKRKTVATDINRNLDQVESLLNKIQFLQQQR